MRMTKGQTVGVQVLQIAEEIDDVVKFALRGRVPEHVAERVVDARVRSTESGEKCRDREETKIEAENDSANCVVCAQQRVQDHVVEQIGSEPVPQIMKGIVSVQHVPQEREQNRVVEQIEVEFRMSCWRRTRRSIFR